MYELSLKPWQKRIYFLAAPLRYPISLLHFEYNSLMFDKLFIDVPWPLDQALSLGLWALSLGL